MSTVLGSPGMQTTALGSFGATANMPNNSGARFGGGLNTFPLQGNLFVETLAAARNPGSTGNDNVLAVFTIPANAFDVAGRGLYFAAAGSFGATANNKRIKLIVGCTTAVIGSAVTGGTTIADTGTIATNGGGWSIAANVYKTGAALSNTQTSLHIEAQVGAAVAALLAPVALTIVESSPIIIAVTGNATTATTDINYFWSQVNVSN